MSDDWLRPSALDCPHCRARLFRVDHSPMSDRERLHCDRCPRFVEVSRYAAEYRAIEPAGEHQVRMAALERALAACPCGGTFRDAAPRRCFSCGEVAVDEPGVDLSPYSPACDEQDRDPTEEELEAFAAFERAFLVTPRWR